MQIKEMAKGGRFQPGMADIRMGGPGASGNVENDGDASGNEGVTLGGQNVDDIWDSKSLEDGEIKGEENGQENEGQVQEEKGQVLDGKWDGSATSPSDQEKVEKLIELLGEGDERYELNANLKVPVKVRGEEVQVTVQDLINNFSGETDFKNRYNSLNRDKQLFENDRKKFTKAQEAWNQFSASLAERINSGKPELIMDAWEDLIDKTGVDPGQFTHQLVQALLPTIQKYSNMSPQEQAIYDKQVEFDAARRKQEREHKRFQSEKEEYERNQFVSQIEQEVLQKNQAYGFNVEQFDNGFKKLQELREKGLFNVTDINPDHVYAYLFQDGVETGTKDFIGKNAPEFAKNSEKANAFVRKMVKTVLTDYWSNELQPKEHYESLAKEWLEKETAVAVSRKVASAKPLTPKTNGAAKKGFGQNAKKSPQLKTPKQVSKDEFDSTEFIQNGRVNW